MVDRGGSSLNAAVACQPLKPLRSRSRSPARADTFAHKKLMQGPMLRRRSNSRKDRVGVGSDENAQLAASSALVRIPATDDH